MRGKRGEEDDISSIPLFPLDLKLETTSHLDQERQKVKRLISFVPSQYEYLSEAFRRHFPNSNVPGEGIRYKFDSRQALRQMLEEYKNSNVIISEDNSAPSKAQSNSQSRKRRRDEIDDEIAQEVLTFPCELVCNTSNNSFAVVALLSKDAKGQTSTLSTRDNSYEDKVVETALLQYNSNLSATLKVTQSGIVLGHLMLDPHSSVHPVNIIDSSLIKNRWIKFTNNFVTLKPPFLPGHDVFGPNSTSQIGREIPCLTIELDERRLWRNPETNQTWEECPRSLLLPDEIFGRLNLQAELCDEALQYGTLDEHDGFVDAHTVPRRNLRLAFKLKNLVMATVEVSGVKNEME